MRCMATCLSAIESGRIDRPAVAASIPLMLADDPIVGCVDVGEQSIAQGDSLAGPSAFADRRVSREVFAGFRPGQPPPFGLEISAGVRWQDLFDLAGTGRMVRALDQTRRGVPPVPQLPRPGQGTGVRAQLALARKEERVGRLPVGPAILLGPHVALRRRHAWHASGNCGTMRGRPCPNLLPVAFRLLACSSLFHDSPFPFVRANDDSPLQSPDASLHNTGNMV